MRGKFRISFCISIRNRLVQLKKTLQHNLGYIHADNQICIGDLGSTDGLREWIFENFARQLASDRLLYFQASEELFWSSPIAKNLAHRIAGGEYLFNLDADNFLTRDDLESISRTFDMGKPCHQWSGTWGDGSYGRIGLPRSTFMTLGGYDDGLLPMGGQDRDIIERLKIFGTPAILLKAPEIAAIKNDKTSSVSEIQSDNLINYEAMNETNLRFAASRRKIMGFNRSGRFQSHRGYLNNKHVTIDGFNRISPEAENGQRAL